MLGNYAHGPRRTMVERVCADLGLELRVTGATGTPSDQPELELARADIVMGYGRSVLEAMACGRAAYVYDYKGGDGWVTAESYPRLEADGFAGEAGMPPLGANGLRADLARYEPTMGMVNRDLAVKHHGARVQLGLEYNLTHATRALAEAHATTAELEAERDALARDGAALRATRRYRFAAALARPLDALRRHRA